MKIISCLLIPSIVGIITGFLGFLLGRISAKKTEKADFSGFSRQTESQKIINEFNNRVNLLQEELKLALSEKKTNQEYSEPELLFNPDIASQVFGKKIKENDFTVIEGIGAKIESLFKQAGINTWFELSETSLEKAKTILAAAGDSMKIHNPGTWARQARMAFDGRWHELKQWQRQLDGGKEKYIT